MSMKNGYLKNVDMTEKLSAGTKSINTYSVTLSFTKANLVS